MEQRGVVVKLKSKTCIVLTSEGEFREIPLPSGERVAVGREIPLKARRSIFSPGGLMIAASFLIFILAGMFYPVSKPVQAVAYLTIDINPSVELAVSKDAKVLSTRGLNSNGDRILSEVHLQGLDLREAVEVVIERAIARQYLSPKGDNVILATLSIENITKPVVELEDVYEAIKRPVDKGQLATDVIIEEITPETRKKAQDSGISAGRYLIVEKSVKKGVPVTINEVSGKHLGALEKEKKVTLVEIMNEERKITQGDKTEKDDSKKETKNENLELTDNNKRDTVDKLNKKPAEKPDDTGKKKGIYEAGNKKNKDPGSNEKGNREKDTSVPLTDRRSNEKGRGPSAPEITR